MAVPGAGTGHRFVPRPSPCRWQKTKNPGCDSRSTGAGNPKWSGIHPIIPRDNLLVPT